MKLRDDIDNDGQVQISIPAIKEEKKLFGGRQNIQLIHLHIHSLSNFFTLFMLTQSWYYSKGLVLWQKQRAGFTLLLCRIVMYKI